MMPVTRFAIAALLALLSATSDPLGSRASAADAGVVTGKKAVVVRKTVVVQETQCRTGWWLTSVRNYYFGPQWATLCDRKYSTSR